MPLLVRPRGKTLISLPAREAAVVAETDVLVVGGGPAGLGAALGAAATGVEVVLVERYGFLGGNATAALVMPLMSFHTRSSLTASRPPRSLMPADHGPGDSVIAGALQTFLERLVKNGGAIPPSEQTGYVVPFDPEVFKLVALDLLDEAGVQFLFHSLATGVLGGARPEGVIFETKSGPVVIRARGIVDCTGDGDVAAFAGATFDVGRAVDHLVQPMTLVFRMVGFDSGAFQSYVRDHPLEWRGVHGLWNLIREATAAGELELPREDILLFGTPHAGEVSVNSTRVTRVLGIDVWDLSYAEWRSRRQMRQIASFLCRYVPGFRDAYVVQSGINVGVRETRRIAGEYQLTADDILRARRFPDVIARGSYPIDIHDPEGPGTDLRPLPPGAAYDIPLRCLLPRGVSGLLVAGRCISGTHEAHSSYRVMPIAMATGQAAGVCAALSVRSGRPPRDVPAGDVQDELGKQGANLGPVLVS